MTRNLGWMSPASRRRGQTAIWVAAASLFLSSPSFANVDAGASGLLSIIPGLGQAVNGEPLEGAAWFVTSVGLYFSGQRIMGQIGYDIWQYNMYDAYRDAKPQIHRYAENNVVENYIATFNPLNVIDPIGAPIFALGAAVGSRNKYAGIRNPTYIPYYAFVGLGEEGLFRGFLFPALSDVITTIPGAIVSSALFSLFHITNGKGALGTWPLTQRFVMGLLFCWQTHLNNYDQRKNIFAHAWWDIFVAPGSPKGVEGKPDGLTAGFTLHF